MTVTEQAEILHAFIAIKF